MMEKRSGGEVKGWDRPWAKPEGSRDVAGS